MGKISKHGFLSTMRRSFAISLCLMLLLSGSAMAMTAADDNEGQKTEQKDDQKDDNKEEKKPRKPILIVVYEFAWPGVTRCSFQKGSLNCRTL